MPKGITLATPALVKRIRKLWDAGYTAPEIATTVGVPVTTVYNYTSRRKKVKSSE